MTSAIRSFLVTSVLVLFCCFIAWFYLKSRTITETPHKPLSTHYFDGLPEFLTALDVTNLKPSKIRDLSPKIIFWIDAQVTSDKKVVVSDDHELPNPNYNASSTDLSPDVKLKQIQIRHLSWADVHRSQPSTRLAEDVFTSDPKRKFIVNVFDYPENADVVFSDLISNLHVDDRIIFYSEEEGPLSDLRKIKPMWLYGTSRAQVVQALWLKSLGLIGLAPLKGDVMISPLTATDGNQTATLVNSDLVAEAHRRSMKVLIGPAPHDEIAHIQSLKADGAIIKDFDQKFFTK